MTRAATAEEVELPLNDSAAAAVEHKELLLKGEEEELAGLDK
jgi:hypothetical protein